MNIDPQRVKELFLAAAELPNQPAQIAYLDQACDGDSELRERVEALLRSHDPASSFLGTPVATLPDSVAAEQTLDSTYPNIIPLAGYADEDEELGFLAPPSRPDSLGRLGHYEMLQVLGKGGFGIVFRAFDDILQRVVAIKVMAPQLAATSPARKRFLREARTSAQVRHENVVQVHEVAEQPLPYLVMEFIPGETLQQRLDRTGPLEILETLHIGRQIADGLAAAHDSDLIHRDIKPGNVLLESGNYKVKITDFGLARAADDASMTQSGMIAGTPMYMAPEQALGQSLDQRADLFSLGSVLYQMVSGRAPFRANSTIAVLKRVAQDTPRDIREIIPETPQWLCEIIAKLHAKNPADRYQSAREVAEVLADCEAQLKESSKLRDFSRIPTVKSSSSAKQILYTAGSAVGVILLLGAVLFKLMEKDSAQGRSVASDQSKVLVGAGTGRASDETARRTEWSNSSSASAPTDDASLVSLPPTHTNSIGMEFVLVPKGQSWLGGGKNKSGDQKVEIAADFYLGKYEVTQQEWTQVMGENPSLFSRTGAYANNVRDLDDEAIQRLPVESVSWDQCQLFVDRLNQREKTAGWAYRLPTEIEWEYASRGGPLRNQSESAFDFYFAQPSNAVTPKQANFKQESGYDRTCEAGSFEPNRLGLYDMHGNVCEWCFNSDALADAMSRPVARGGGWNVAHWDAAAMPRSVGSRTDRHFAIGFRLARVPTAVHSALASTPAVADAAPTAVAARPFTALSAAEQVVDVATELKRRNPGFDGALTPTIENDVVTGLAFFTNHVADISPVRNLTRLTSLSCRADSGSLGILSDLSPLRGMRLEKLTLSANSFSDLSPLQGMPLTDLHVDNSQVSDLSPLAGMQLRALNCSFSKVASLAPLQDMPLLALWCNNTMIADLSPIKGKSLDWVTFHATKVTDTSALQGMPLTQIYLDYVPARDREILRSLPLLQRINDLPSAEFWQKHERDP